MRAEPVRADASLCLWFWLSLAPESLWNRTRLSGSRVSLCLTSLWVPCLWLPCLSGSRVSLAPESLWNRTRLSGSRVSLCLTSLWVPCLSGSRVSLEPDAPLSGSPSRETSKISFCGLYFCTNCIHFTHEFPSLKFCVNSHIPRRYSHWATTTSLVWSRLSCPCLKQETSFLLTPAFQAMNLFMSTTLGQLWHAGRRVCVRTHSDANATFRKHCCAKAWRG